jgi:acetylornithine deacetylase/succinyl-diaminopimelate desuccinylase-like protein
MSSARVVRRVLVLALVVAFVLVCPVSIRASEKILQGYRLEVTNRGGHSSLPVRDNAIWHLASGLRLGDFDFPVNLDEVNRQFFERSAAQISGSLGNDIGAVVRGERDRAVVARVAAVGPVFNSRLRTTCVPTRLEGGGHADNALPQTAHAVVNCRVLPSETEADVRQMLIRALANDKIKVTPVNKFFPSPASPLMPEIMAAVEGVTQAIVTQAMWPGVPRRADDVDRRYRFEISTLRRHCRLRHLDRSTTGRSISTDS